MDSKLYSWLWLNMTLGINLTLFEQVMALYTDVERVYSLARSKSISAFNRLGSAAAKRICTAVDDKMVDLRLEWLQKHKVRILPLYSEEYPALLKQIRRPPAMLYVKGNMEPEPMLPIAIVGMRNHTPYGEAVAKHFAGELVRNGATIVSGMALGIDACAAKGALAVHGRALATIAVLGSGVDVIYPSENARLYDEIVESGAVISEFLPGTKPMRENFPMRNRIISGLSRGVIVVEAARRSGTTITANHALEQGRDVFAVPGRITDEQSFGPNGMIQRGEAKPVFCAADILVEYGVSPSATVRPNQSETDGESIHSANAAIDLRPGKSKIRGNDTAPQACSEHDVQTRDNPDMAGLTQTELLIVDALKQGDKSADELCELLSLNAAMLNSSLTSLQISGIIKQLPGRVFGL